MMLSVLLCALLVASALGQGREPPEYRDVYSPQGPVRGYKEFDGIFVFHGIPYAQAPTGVNKFKAPLAAKTWTEIFLAIPSDIICPQVGPQIELPVENPIPRTEQEDCLLATVYTPDTEATNLPVVVYVHGGGYHQGWGDLWSPRSFTGSGRVIGVTFHFRLGIHGFLCLGTSAAPGNAGMKDIVALLRWVNANIASYGGNPNDVTVSGWNTGGSSVDLLMLSKSATGLYHKVIPESGANVAVWSVQQDPIENAKNYARTQGFTNVDDAEALEEFYTTASIEMLSHHDFMNRTDSTYGFGPCVEKYIGEDRFLDDAPVNILQEGNHNKVPMLYGFTRMEGLIRVQLFDEWSIKMNEQFSDFLPADLQFEDEEQREQVAQIVKQFYFGNQPVSLDTIFQYVDYFTHVMFAYPILRAIRLQVESGNNDIYLYDYSFVAEEFSSGHDDVDVRGASNSAQTFILLDSMVSWFETNRSLYFQEEMRAIWLDFMTTGNPVPGGSTLPVSWPPVGNAQLRGPYMTLDTNLQIGGGLLPDRTQFWDNIYELFYRPPVQPSSASSLYVNLLLGLGLLFIRFLL